jgi:hypothetical protein
VQLAARRGNSLRLLSLLPRILAIFLIILPPLFAIRQPEIMQASDFVMTFYPAGAMIASGQAAGIYPPPGATSFIDTPFNLFAHKLLAYLPNNNVAIYMYPPLVAAVFVPFSWLSAPAALVLWQVVTVAVMALVAFMFAAGSSKKGFDYFFMMALFCPIFHTLLIGHLGVVLGLLPLALGYLLLTKGKEIGAGYAWGFLAFKPQFLPAVLLMAGALLLTKRPKVVIGLILGLLTFAALSATVLGPDIFVSWLASLKMADTIFANPAYGFPEYMVVSLPAVLLQCFPHAARAMAKIPIYGIAAASGLFTLWRCVLLLRQVETGARSQGAADDAEQSKNSARSLALIMTTGLLVLPLVLPHFLYYDMCALALICIIAYQDCWHTADGGVMRAVRRLMWWVCNIYYCSFMFLTVKPLKQWFALLLVLFFGFLYYRVLKLFGKTAIDAKD